MGVDWHEELDLRAAGAKACCFLLTAVGDEDREPLGEDWATSEAAHGGVVVSRPAQARRRRISVMALRRVVIELDLTGGFF